MKTHEAQGKKRWKVVKEADDEYSDREWEDVEVVVEKEVVKWMVVVKNKEERMMMRREELCCPSRVEGEERRAARLPEDLQARAQRTRDGVRGRPE
ncbi:hypothetical protein GUJ93_ZPchr0012g20871 [Zizania palustris]|uniref:Uncharacterized protein n=1 Tax=Zizania palustris TaxID=103762 RepID=A0A8J5WUN7_ZIZPA|nr:hypothetical protein GUJ93_ZPchr0012g20871 [Zizania palustris]